MRTTEQDISKFAKSLEEARSTGTEIAQLTSLRSDLSAEDAYRIQATGIRLRSVRGERIAGYKMGLTSKAKMQQVGVHQPIYGVLLESMQVSDGADYDLSKNIHPRIEPEIAFLIGRDIDSVLSPTQALQYCAGVAPALEIIDSRYKDFSFTLPDVIADNCSASAFVIGTMSKRPDRMDLANLGIVMEKNGEPLQFASAAAVLGHPLRALVELIKVLVGQGEVLRAGAIVLSGGATAALPFEVGDIIRAQVQGLGSVTVKGKASNLK